MKRKAIALVMSMILLLSTALAGCSSGQTTPSTIVQATMTKNSTESIQVNTTAAISKGTRDNPYPFKEKVLINAKCSDGKEAEISLTPNQFVDDKTLQSKWPNYKLDKRSSFSIDVSLQKFQGGDSYDFRDVLFFAVTKNLVEIHCSAPSTEEINGNRAVLFEGGSMKMFTSTTVAPNQSDDTIQYFLVKFTDYKTNNKRTIWFSVQGNNNSVETQIGKTTLTTSTYDDKTPDNKQGNTTGNLQNWGKATFQGNWIYFQGNDGAMYKSRKDGSSSTNITKNGANYINVVGTWIYYMGSGNCIYKIKTDGSGDTRINFDAKCEYVTVIGDWIYYYMNNEDEPAFIKMRVDGTERKVIYKLPKFSSISGFVVYDNWIYFVISNASSKEHALYKIKDDGTSLVRLIVGNYFANKFIKFDISNGWLYYSNSDYQNKIYKMKIDGTGNTLLIDDMAASINIAGDWLYYSNEDDNLYLYKIKLDGTNKMKLNNVGCYLINIVDDLVFYNDIKSNKRYKVVPDGSGKMEMVSP